MNSPQDKKSMQKPRVGFLGMGWIGISRMEAIIRENSVNVAAVADPDAAVENKVKKLVPDAIFCKDLHELLKSQIDAVVIATPSALHCEQSIKALNSGAAVFCQKPLGRTAHETIDVIEKAKQMNLLLGIDFSYRFVRSLKAVYDLIVNGGIGDIYAVNLIFHNAFGPNKEWFYDLSQSGGGCVIDLGIHLIDLALWILDNPKIVQCVSKLFSHAKQFESGTNKVEDFAAAQLTTEKGVVINLACSWHLSAGKDAIIKAEFYSKDNAAVWENVDGSFYNFKSMKMKGTSSELLYYGPDDWYGKAAADWSNKLTENKAYDSKIESAGYVAKIVDMIYQR
jgi:predicted dehydrogenase